MDQVKEEDTDNENNTNGGKSQATGTTRLSLKKA